MEDLNGALENIESSKKLTLKLKHGWANLANVGYVKISAQKISASWDSIF